MKLVWQVNQRRENQIFLQESSRKIWKNCGMGYATIMRHCWSTFAIALLLMVYLKVVQSSAVLHGKPYDQYFLSDTSNDGEPQDFGSSRKNGFSPNRPSQVGSQKYHDSYTAGYMASRNADNGDSYMNEPSAHEHKFENHIEHERISAPMSAYGDTERSTDSQKTGLNDRNIQPGPDTPYTSQIVRNTGPRSTSLYSSLIERNTSPGRNSHYANLNERNTETEPISPFTISHEENIRSGHGIHHASVGEWNTGPISPDNQYASLHDSYAVSGSAARRSSMSGPFPSTDSSLPAVHLHSEFNDNTDTAFISRKPKTYSHSLDGRGIMGTGVNNMMKSNPSNCHGDEFVVQNSKQCGIKQCSTLVSGNYIRYEYRTTIDGHKICTCVGCDRRMDTPD